ncbi:3'-phosphoadenosine 5'-phosphosulfate sulfotransferase (PAPS reductase)/FAD synthetase [Ectothiorhodospira magna]|uniref:3'-phosphoadenosine 5'-phosphosulfate sulfotransferase (PAPS reductase)/FAD synthetase n=1 Tax=Ectothiorhodospira magna TaxID=867345 RepID=A0A1H9DL52_9GAMM|nr:phosphoadenosine phosphosulfate reductase family protein [Ectothiorhodospira magna]SEQ14037.1 3'-phosphoadenosine 5'-phosphosulfate sulfotransferase (PAPS reductase)/FAD synthetase [Ectothiorhodospira magna]
MATIEEALNRTNDPDIKHIVSLSGGKDSTALALFMRDNYPQLKVEYVFCDTGVELPETEEYLERLEARLGTKVTRLDAFAKLKAVKKGKRNAFDMWLQVYGGYLPSPRSRWCTRVLKIEPFERYVGANTAFSYIGIRYDENREGYQQQSKKPPALSDKPNILPVYPFKEHRMGLRDIERLLEESGLGLPKYYEWRSRSGCYFCFYQQKGEWQALKRHHPDLFERAKQYERPINGKQFTWVEGRSLEELEKDPRKYDVKAPEDVDGCAVCHL